MEWREKGACWGITISPETDYWYPEEDDEDKALKIETAKAICSQCPVLDECFEYALEYEDEFGIWGGKTPRERRAYKRKLAKANGTV
jgi:WhiB family redox-sensing transcriptional regulator